MGSPSTALRLVHEPSPEPSSEDPAKGFNEDGTWGAAPAPSAPRYMHACHHGRWKLATWKRSAPSDASFRTARCNSWRHEGECQRKKCSEDYARIAEALAANERANIMYCVLTLDPSAWTPDGWSQYDGDQVERRPDAKECEKAMGQAYKELGDRFHVLRQHLRRRFDSVAYVATVEAHRSGWPHLNVVIVSANMAHRVRELSVGLGAWSRKARGREVARLLFGPALERAGFGRIAFLEPAGELDADGGDPLAGYIAKLAGTIGTPFEGGKAGGLVESIEGRMIGEVIKASQVPHQAPPNFRRLRSSRRFLPPVRRDPDITGAMFDESGNRIGAKRVDPWIELLEQNECAPKSVQMSIERSMIQWLDSRCDWVPTEAVDGSTEYVWRAEKDVDGNDRVRLAHAVANMRGESIDHLPEIEERPESVPCGAILEPMSGTVIHGPADIEAVAGPFGPGMEGTGRKYKMRPGLVFTNGEQRNEHTKETKHGQDTRTTEPQATGPDQTAGSW